MSALRAIKPAQAGARKRGEHFVLLERADGNVNVYFGGLPGIPSLDTAELIAEADAGNGYAARALWLSLADALGSDNVAHRPDALAQWLAARAVALTRARTEHAAEAAQIARSAPRQFRAHEKARACVELARELIARGRSRRRACNEAGGHLDAHSSNVRRWLRERAHEPQAHELIEASCGGSGLAARRLWSAAGAYLDKLIAPENPALAAWVQGRAEALAYAAPSQAASAAGISGSDARRVPQACKGAIAGLDADRIGVREAARRAGIEPRVVRQWRRASG